jgi:hypothetical protein
MPKSRNRKDHKKKVLARNRRIKETRNRLNNLVRKELEAKIAAQESAAELGADQTSINLPTQEITIAEDAKL